MATIQHFLRPVQKLCPHGLRAHVLFMFLGAVFILGFENSAIFFRKDLLTLDPDRKISPSDSYTKQADSKYCSGGEETSENLEISSNSSLRLEKLKISSNFSQDTSLGTEKTEILDDTGKGALVLEKKLGSSVEKKADITGNFSVKMEKLKISINSSVGQKKIEILNHAFSPPRGFPANEALVLEKEEMGSSGEKEKTDILSSSSLGMEKIKILDRTSSPAASSPTNGKLVQEKETKNQLPARNKEMETRNCVREEDPRQRREEIEPIRTIREMSEILERNRRHSCSPIPSWFSPVDREILRARREILNAPSSVNDPVLYPPVYRNFSAFKRSYKLMEKMLKVYVYKEGKKPIFHESHLSGIYAAEGWFLKHMEGKNRFLVDDPSKAHLFFLPFSSTNLRIKVYVSNSHDKKNMIQFLKNYMADMAAKYPFWNRTGGADHFSVGCHDWASKLTALSMGDTIRALCNTDLRSVFELGKDVSITLTPIHNSRNPLRNVGGKPSHKRDSLAFFSGQMHGYVRPLLLHYWGNNSDPEIQVFSPLPKGGRTYVEHMKSSKFCLCPSGYEVNSPRLAETFFYECVPVIIFDNFVPPFFEVLNWEAFSVVVPVKDIPKLKEILLSVTPAKYRVLQFGVKMVQWHFLWHLKPDRYDLFHMTLHSVWFNRVFQFRDAESEKVLYDLVGGKKR